MTEQSTAVDTGLDREKFALERERFEFEKRKHELERVSKVVDLNRIIIEQANSVLVVVRYLNELRDENVEELVEGHQTTTIRRPSREWNPLEEQLANASVKTLCLLIGSMCGAKTPRDEKIIQGRTGPNETHRQDCDR